MNQEAKYTTTVKIYALSGAAWALIATLAGFLNQIQLYLGWPGTESIFGYGYLRPMYTTMLIFGAGLSFFLASAYYMMHKNEGAAMKGEPVALIAFVLHQFALVLGLVSIAAGANSGREYGEMSWIADNILALSLLIFVVLTAVNLQGVAHPIRGSVFAFLAATGALVVFFLGNTGQPYSILSNAPLYAGMQDAAAQEFYRSGVLGFFILMPLFSTLFFFVPVHHGKDLYSKSGANFQAMAMTVLIPLAGGAGLAYTTAPGMTAGIGMVASLALFVTLLMGYINISKTRAGASGDAYSGLMSMGLILLMVFGLIRALYSLPFMQAMFGYTWFNMSDISVDAQTYALMIFFGAGAIMLQRVTNREAVASYAKIQFLLMLVGTLLVLVGNVLHGVVESSAMSSMADGSLTVESWSQVILAGSLNSEGGMAGQYIMSLRGVVLLGYLALLAGVALGTYNLFTTQNENGKPYQAPASA